MWPKIAQNYVLPSSTKMALLFSDYNSMTFHQDSIWLGKLLKLIMEIGTFQRSSGPGASKEEWKEAPRGEPVKSTPQLSCRKVGKSQQSVRSVNLSHPQHTRVCVCVRGPQAFFPFHSGRKKCTIWTAVKSITRHNEAHFIACTTPR